MVVARTAIPDILRIFPAPRVRGRGIPNRHSGYAQSSDDLRCTDLGYVSERPGQLIFESTSWRMRRRRLGRPGQATVAPSTCRTARKRRERTWDGGLRAVQPFLPAPSPPRRLRGNHHGPGLRAASGTRHAAAAGAPRAPAWRRLRGQRGQAGGGARRGTVRRVVRCARLGDAMDSLDCAAAALRHARVSGEAPHR